MDIVEIMNWRYTTKAFDKARRINPELVAKIEAVLRGTPSSTNLQPWHFIIAGTEEGKGSVARATAAYPFNAPKILDASHVVVLCTRTVPDEAYLGALLDAEAHDGRFADQKARDGQHAGRSHFVNMHRFERRDLQQWADKQVYIAVGTLLVAAASLGIDACPMEGFDQAALDAELGLRARGLSSAVIVALGYRSVGDFNAALPKSRLPQDKVITRI